MKDFTLILEYFNMLLLILFAGCLASGAAQTTSFPFSATTTTTPAPLTQLIQSTAVQPSLDVVAILEAAVLSGLELNETTLDPILAQVQAIIQSNAPDVIFSVSVKNITQV